MKSERQLEDSGGLGMVDSGEKSRGRRSKEVEEFGAGGGEAFRCGGEGSCRG